MPELPDIVTYQNALRARLAGARLGSIVLTNPFLLRTVTPRVEQLAGLAVRDIEHLGKRIVIALDDAFFIVIHLMIAGRLHWYAAGTKPKNPRSTLARFNFDTGILTLTEAGTKRRAALHLYAGRAALAAADPGGIDVLASDLATFTARLTSANHTVKRALTVPHLFSGIGNAYSDEILHRARLSPFVRTQALAPPLVARLHQAVRAVLSEWIERLAAQAAGAFPEHVSAFRPEMAVHGRYRQPCPDCGAPVQRIVYADNETNYCARCQTGGQILADRALSRLLKDSFPRHLEDAG
jgi:formamidopyrimidine-DNA glycosylase